MNIEYIYLNVVYSPTTVRTFYKKLIVNVIYNIQSQALEILYGIKCYTEKYIQKHAGSFSYVRNLKILKI